MKLTDEQLAIVAHPLEPLRISAGAGTGKTTTIVKRLAAAVADGIDPEAVLGITFTNKAAEELGTRLRNELADLAAEGREVQVATYHGFAFQLLLEYGALVGVERTTSIIGTGFQRQLLDESFGEHEYQHLDLTSRPHRVGEAATLARQLGDNLKTPADLLGHRDVASDDVAEKRAELAEVLGTYGAAKRRLGVVDYGDLIRLAHELASTHPAVRASIRDRYRLVVVDEYQDTDPGQRLLLQTLFGAAFPITAVGDEDQTIYEWRGASLENFTGFPSHFPAADGKPSRTLPLTLNRRSDRIIIDLANAIRGRLHETYDPLRPLPSAAAGILEVGWLRTETDEAGWIADRIRTLHDEDGVPWSEISVLFRKNRHIPAVRDALEAAGVPVDVVSLGGLLSVPEVAELHAWLRILNDPEDGPALARILLGARFRLGFGDLAPLSRWSRTQDEYDEELPHSLLEGIDRLDEIRDLRPEARRRLVEFAGIYRALLVVAQGVSLSELSRRILDRLGAWAEVDALPDHARLSARLNLYRFLDIAEGWSPLEGRPSLDAFLGYLELLVEEDDVEELDTAVPSSDDAVSLLTVHRAKGLEWDVVFLPALAAGTFPAKSQGYDNPVDQPKYLPHALRIDAEALPDLDAAPTQRARTDLLAARHDAQEWRTAYVAVTRARHILVLTGAHWGSGTRSRRPSPLWEAAAAIDGTTTGVLVEEPGERPEEAPVSPSGASPDPLFPEGWQAALEQAHATAGGTADPDVAARAEQLRLLLTDLPEPVAGPEPGPMRISVTGLVTLATCPLRYRWAEVDRLPRRPDASRRHGVDFHRKAELHNLGVVPLEERDEGLYDLPSESAPDSTESAYSRFLASRFGTTRPAHVEIPIELRLSEAMVRGRIDAVYADEDGWEVVDYKSGTERPEDARLVQLQAYAVAAADGAVASPTPQRLQVTFAYFGGGTVAEQTWEADAGFLAEARERLDDLASIAVRGAFEPTPSDACHRCDFLRFCDAGSAYVAR